MLANQARIKSILKSETLATAVTSCPTFHLSQLQLSPIPNFELPGNLRLGHLVEKSVAELIKCSNNYKLLFENIQILNGKKTIGELDFIIQETTTNQLIHLELAYKFYLFAPSISSEQKNNWIGPNRNDSLVEKLDKLKQKQFPLLYHECTKKALDTLPIKDIQQQLCLLASLYIPYNYKGEIVTDYQKAIKGYYISFNRLSSIQTTEKKYYIPAKKEWGIHPSENKIWLNYAELQEKIEASIKEKQAVLCWENDKGIYSELFIVWWT